jgi:hypothetical protein
MSFTLSNLNHGADNYFAAYHNMERPAEDVAYFDCGSIGDSDSITNTITDTINQTQRFFLTLVLPKPKPL